MTMDASTCLATYARPSMLRRNPDQRAMRASTFVTMAVWRAVAAAAGWLDRGMPRCMTLPPGAAKVTPVTGSGPVKWVDARVH